MCSFSLFCFVLFYFVKEKRTVFLLAAEYGCEEMVKMLMSRGANTSVTNKVIIIPRQR